jgi:hypothetical protein
MGTEFPALFVYTVFHRVHLSSFLVKLVVLFKLIKEGSVEAGDQAIVEK